MSLEVDLRTNVRSIKDQGRRGTCVACAVTAAHEMIRAEGIELSIEFMHWASKRRDGLPRMVEGTTLPAARIALREDGQPPETMWPYDEYRNQWLMSYLPPSAASLEAKSRLLIGGDEIAPGAPEVRDELDRGRPVVLGVRLHATWYGIGSDGRISMPTVGARDFGGHAILAVGYQADEFIVQNSWGNDWGKDGLAFLPGDYVDRFGISAWSLAL